MAGAGPSSASLARTAVGVSGTNRLPNSGMLRIQQELHTLIRDPVPFIYVAADEADISKITTLIVGPLETPYAGGFFHLDIRIPPEYPMKPPNVTLRTTDGGRVRFNPNLYSNGKVCLSILGTWEGPAWSSAESLSSVLLSIQSLMCPKPYHNEPGYETRGDESTVNAYNDYIRYETLRTAVVGMLRRPTCVGVFEDVLERQFLLWYDMYVSIAKDLKTRREGCSYKDVFSSARGQYNLTVVLDSLKEVKESILQKVKTVDKPISIADQPSAGADQSGTPYAIDRLQDEYRMLLAQTLTGASASPRDRNDPFIWDATIMGPEKTPWEGGLFSLEIRFSPQHPYRPPFVWFTSKMFHPNITSDGVPAIEILQSRWNSKTRLTTILNELQNLLGSPSPLYPVHLEAANMFRTDRKQYERRARRIAQEV